MKSLIRKTWKIYKNNKKPQKGIPCGILDSLITSLYNAFEKNLEWKRK